MINKPQSISVYRALTGPVHYHQETGWVFTGISEQQLKQTGASISNQSAVQESRRSILTGGDDLIGPRVEGLPVFLTQGEAAGWLEDKVFTYPPVIARIDLPYDLLAGGELKIVKNGGWSGSDITLTKSELTNLIQNTSDLRGECFIQGTSGVIPGDILRPLEKFFRPAEMNEGKVVLEKGFKELVIESLDPEITGESRI